MPKRRRTTSLGRYPSVAPLVPPSSPVVVVLSAFVVETGGRPSGNEWFIFLKNVSNRKGMEKEKKNLLSAQETSCDVSWAIPCCVVVIRSI
jgi:hypothetical protein